MLEHYLCCYINYNQNNWAQWISLIQFIYNNIKYNIIRLTLTEILFKTQLQLCIDINTNNKHFKVKKVVNYTISLQNVHTQLIKCLQKIHEM